MRPNTSVTEKLTLVNHYISNRRTETCEPLHQQQKN